VHRPTSLQVSSSSRCAFVASISVARRSGRRSPLQLTLGLTEPVVRTVDWLRFGSLSLATSLVEPAATKVRGGWGGGSETRWRGWAIQAPTTAADPRTPPHRREPATLSVTRSSKRGRGCRHYDPGQSSEEFSNAAGVEIEDRCWARRAGSHLGCGTMVRSSLHRRRPLAAVNVPYRWHWHAPSNQSASSCHVASEGRPCRRHGFAQRLREVEFGRVGRSSRPARWLPAFERPSVGSRRPAIRSRSVRFPGTLAPTTPTRSPSNPASTVDPFLSTGQSN